MPKSEVRAMYVIVTVSLQILHFFLFNAYKTWKSSSADFERTISGERECGRNLTSSTNTSKPHNQKRAELFGGHHGIHRP